MQSKKHSIYESVTNVVAGYISAILVQMIIFPIFNINTSVSENMTIALIFTVVSLIRSYVIRRMFNRYTHKIGS